MGTPSSNELQESLDKAFDLVEEDTLSQDPELLHDEPSLSEDIEAFDAPAAADQTKASKLALYLGVALVIGGFGLAVAPLSGAVSAGTLAKLQSLGLSPALFFVCGVVLTSLGWSQITNLRSNSSMLSGLMSGELQHVHDQVREIADEARNANSDTRFSKELEHGRRMAPLGARSR